MSRLSLLCRRFDKAVLKSPPSPIRTAYMVEALKFFPALGEMGHAVAIGSTLMQDQVPIPPDALCDFHSRLTDSSVVGTSLERIAVDLAAKIAVRVDKQLYTSGNDAVTVAKFLPWSRSEMPLARDTILRVLLLFLQNQSFDDYANTRALCFAGRYIQKDLDDEVTHIAKRVAALRISLMSATTDPVPTVCASPCLRAVRSCLPWTQSKNDASHVAVTRVGLRALSCLGQGEVMSMIDAEDALVVCRAVMERWDATLILRRDAPRVRLLAMKVGQKSQISSGIIEIVCRVAKQIVEMHDDAQEEIPLTLKQAINSLEGI